MSQDELTRNTEHFLVFLGHTEVKTTYFRAVGKRTNSLRIDGPDDIDKFIRENNGKQQSYVGLNPVNPGFDKRHATTDADTPYIINVLLDVDADRVGISSEYMATQEEYEKAWAAASKIRDSLESRFPGIVIYADKTGNGYRFIIPIPKVDVSTDEKRALWTGKIKALYNLIEKKLDELYETLDEKPGAALDKRVFNPSRITGIPGTMNIKKTAEGREHRLRECGVIPDRVESQELLDFIMSLKPVIDKKEPKPANETTKTVFTKTGKHDSESTLIKINNLLPKDEKLRRLYSEELNTYKDEYGYPSRSEAEQALYNKLVYYEFSDIKIDIILFNAKIGKWKGAKPTYKERTKIKAHLQCSECTEKVTKPYGMTDLGNAQRIDDMFGEDLLYCHKSKKWLNWDGSIWKEDDMGTIYKLAKKSVVAIHEYAESLPVGDIETDGGAVVKEKSYFKKKWHKHASSSESTARFKAMVENLKTEDNIPASMEDMDLNGWVLPVQNGTIDLKTGQLYEPKRADMCTKMINVVYNPAAKCPNWDKFLSEVLPDPDTRRYMKELVGYCLTGETNEEQVYILYGTGSNGKSTFTDTILLLLGDFGINVKASTLLTSDNKQSTPDNEIARLKGKRIAAAAEPKKGIRLGEDVIKAITNAKSKIPARFLYQEPFEFFPTHKVLLSTNHKPTVTDQSRGMRRRLRLIPFITTIEEEARDMELSDKLENELSGILNWAIEGCLSWQETGRLEMSAEIKRETTGYMADMDRVGEFLGTVTEPGEYKDVVPNMWLRDLYNIWAERMGFRPMNNNTFNEAMIERDFKTMKLNGRVQWRGLKKIITKIKDVEKQHQGRLVETSRDLVETETPTRETVDTFLETLNNIIKINGGNCDIEEVRKYIEENISLKVSTVSLDSETVSTKSHLIAKTENNNGNGSCNDGSQIYLTKEQIIEDVVKDHGETPTKGNVMYLAGLVHKRKDTYSLYEAAADIKKKYNLDVKPSKEASDKLTADLKSSDGVLPEIERQFKEKYDDVDFENLYGRMQGFRHKYKGNNGKLKPIDDIDKLTFSFVSADDGKEWQNNEGPVKAMLEVMVKHDNNGGVPA